MTSRFASATREELWIGGRRVESHLSHGIAVEMDGEIRASDEADPLLLRRCEEEIEAMRAAAAAAAVPQARLVAHAAEDEITAIVVLTLGVLSVVSSAADLDADWQLLRESAPKEEPRAIDWRGIPIVWRNGSAAVLLHEAVGHAAEHGHAGVDWPAWLSVSDDGRDLLSVVSGFELRRAGFADVPLPRMRELAASHDSAPFAMPDPRLEILLVDGGSYEPLTEQVDVRVAAARWHAGSDVSDVEPFTISSSRAGVARALRGATGPPIRYPGVICSREGQELLVRSSAPLMVTVFS
jgi:hypothetical protein